MTPFEKAADILADLQAAAATAGHALPAARWSYAMVGNNVIACEGLTVNVVSATLLPLNSPETFSASQLQVIECGAAQLGTFNIAVARACGSVTDDHGVDNPKKVAEVSAQMDADGQLLWNWANDYEAWIQKDFSMGFAITGDLSIVSLQLVTGID